MVQEGLHTAPVQETLAWNQGHPRHCHQHWGHPVRSGNWRYPNCRPCSQLLL